MALTWSDLRQRDQHERAPQHSGMWNDQLWRCEDHIVEEQNVDVNHARTIARAVDTAKITLYTLERAQQ
jgi:hypothetical protein